MRIVVMIDRGWRADSASPGHPKRRTQDFEDTWAAAARGLPGDPGYRAGLLFATGVAVLALMVAAAFIRRQTPEPAEPATAPCGVWNQGRTPPEPVMPGPRTQPRSATCH